MGRGGGRGLLESGRDGDASRPQWQCEWQQVGVQVPVALDGQGAYMTFSSNQLENKNTRLRSLRVSARVFIQLFIYTPTNNQLPPSTHHSELARIVTETLGSKMVAFELVL